MSLTTFDEVRPYARAIKTRTGMGPKAGVMPPWFIEKAAYLYAAKKDYATAVSSLLRVDTTDAADAPVE